VQKRDVHYIHYMPRPEEPELPPEARARGRSGGEELLRYSFSLLPRCNVTPFYYFLDVMFFFFRLCAKTKL
jgi:hypothetical protein